MLPYSSGTREVQGKRFTVQLMPAKSKMAIEACNARNTMDRENDRFMLYLFMTKSCARMATATSSILTRPRGVLSILRQGREVRRHPIIKAGRGGGKRGWNSKREVHRGS